MGTWLAHALDLNDVAMRARDLAAAPYNKGADMPKTLQNLHYDQYRDIRFKPEQNLWRNDKLPFEIAFFHMGFNFDKPVKINEVTERGTREIKFDPEAFDFGANKIDRRALRDVGFAGLRVHFPINTSNYKDEVLVFLGASYFRALGRGQTYGASARGIAIDTAMSSGEEFPRFIEFWVERPARDARALTIYALLDSRRLTGAYRFILRPGTETIIETKARLFLRESVDKFGLAPITSMFFFGENQRSGAEDFRPEVHDSDGLSIHSASGEWIWRPLVNPRRLLVTSFAATDPVGFGLMQRDQHFNHYEDLEARYDRRPSVWVEPRGKWGAGRIELVQIPTPDETNDNIVAYWVPNTSPAPKQPYDIEYRVFWQKTIETKPPLAWVSQTRRGRGYVRSRDSSLAYTVDFEGQAIKALPSDAKLELMLSADANGEILERNLHRNEVTGGQRMTLRLRRIDDKKPVELRAQMRAQSRNGNQAISETWSYILPPE